MKNSLAITHADLCKEWSDKNVLTPEQVTAGSHERIWWKGACGHEWQTKVMNRTQFATACPYCTSRSILKGFNDLATLRPDVAKSWSERNAPLEPDQVMPYSRKRVWWKCNKGHEWQASVNQRSQGHGCPYCANKILLRGFNDVATRYPKLAEEWSERNEVKLSELLSPKNIILWWKCPDCGQEYRRSLQLRAARDKDCPYCDAREAKVGINDLTTTHPHLAAEWNHEMNNECKPHMVTYKSKRFVWWKCHYGHDYGYKVFERTLGEKKCSFCEAEFQAAFPQLLAIYCAKQLGAAALVDYKINKRLAVQLYITQINTIIELQEFSEEKRIIQLEKLEKCRDKGIDYVIVPKSYDEKEAITEISRIFEEKGYSLEVNSEEIAETLRKIFFEIKDEIVKEARLKHE